MSGDQMARICRGQVPKVSVDVLSGILSAVGLHLSAKAYPGNPPIRDASHLALLARFRARLGTGVRWRTEVPVVSSPLDPGGRGTRDRRAWDAVIEGAGWRVGVEAETRIHDVQALQRRLALKQRDGDVRAVILVVNDTVHNRRVVALEQIELVSQFPTPARACFRRLAAGLPPEGNGLVVL
jgi:hypothetical protein